MAYRSQPVNNLAKEQLMDSLLDKASSLLASLPCEFAEIRLSESTSTSINLSGSSVDSFSSGDSIGGSIRVLYNGAWGFVSFNDPSELESLVKKALDLASRMNVSEKSVVVHSRPLTGHYETPCEKDFSRVSIEEKFKLIGKYNDLLRASEKVVTTRAGYLDSKSRYSYLNSEGSRLTYDKSYCGISLSSVAKDGSLIQPFNDSVSGYGGYEIVENRESMAEEVIRIAVDLLSAESPDGGTHTIIADPKLAGVFIHEAFGHLSEADFVHENPRLKEIMTLGKKFGPEALNVYDDGNMPGLSGYIPFDDEGIIPLKTSLITKGILSGRLHSRETAASMNEDLTGNARALGSMRQPIVRMTCTYIENGGYSPEQIFDAMDDGIYACDVIGGQTNLEMFTFTAGYGYKIKNGRKGKMFRDIVLSGNVFNTLGNISMVGNDRKMFGGLGGCGKGGQSPLPVSFGGPHIMIKDVLIGGKQ